MTDATLDPNIDPNIDSDIASTIDADIVRTTSGAPAQRLLSIDLLRGLTIAVMIIVNNQMPPQPFHELVHATWNGFTLTDLVFPTFVFLVGLTTVLSTAARLSRGVSRRSLFLHTLRRTGLLLVFGFVVNNFPFFHMYAARYYGVLPRIAICYFVVASLYLLSPSWKDKVAVPIACLVGYWVLMRFVPVPGFGTPTHEIPINSHNANLAAWVDRQLFSPMHLYEKTRDPEGLLSTLPAIATALYGLITGIFLRSRNPTTYKAAVLSVAGTLLVALGLAWNFSFPINKKLWTSSFSLFAGGLSLLLLATSILLIDVLLRKPYADDDPTHPQAHPLVYRGLLVFGTNAILVYMISELLDPLLKRVLFTSSGLSWAATAFAHLRPLIPDPRWASLTYSLLFTLICWLAVLPFYRKRLFLRI